MATLMNVVFTTMLSASGGNNYPIQNSAVTFETFDEVGCETTAKLLLGTGANESQGVWYIRDGSLKQTVICFPKSFKGKPGVNRGNKK